MRTHWCVKDVAYLWIEFFVFPWEIKIEQKSQQLHDLYQNIDKQI